jgi:hypothetical protein
MVVGVRAILPAPIMRATSAGAEARSRVAAPASAPSTDQAPRPMIITAMPSASSRGSRTWEGSWRECTPADGSGQRPCGAPPRCGGRAHGLRGWPARCDAQAGRRSRRVQHRWLHTPVPLGNHHAAAEVRLARRACGPLRRTGRRRVRWCAEPRLYRLEARITPIRCTHRRIHIGCPRGRRALPMTASWLLQSGGRERSCLDESTVYWLMIMPVSTGFSSGR